MNFYSLQEQATALALEALEEATPVRPESCGLDRRSAGTLFIGDDYVAVAKSSDRTLQYYGGFEYVDKEYRTELGGYVFYSTEDERVAEHHDRVSGVEGNSDEPENEE